MDGIAKSHEPRRRHKRFSPPRAQVTCVPRGFWAPLIKGRNVALYLRDVSLGGAQIVAAKPLATGLKTDITITFAGFPDPVQMEADVRWCRRDTLSLAPKYNAGLTIKQIAPDHEFRLANIDRTYLGYLG